MPKRPSGKTLFKLYGLSVMAIITVAQPLRQLCMQTIAVQYENICYGCSSREEMNYLLDVENEEEDGYQDYPGPFVQYPSSLLEDLVSVMNDLRRLPKQMLHQIIQPQLEVVPSTF